MKVNRIPAKAYGLDPSTGKLVERGAAIGIIAAQSIGEPGTQLTMRTFHSGGIAVLKAPEIRAPFDATVEYGDNIRYVKLAGGIHLVTNKNGVIRLRDKNHPEREPEEFTILIGTTIGVGPGDEIGKGDLLATWDPNTAPILAEKKGVVTFRHMTLGVTTKRELDSSGRAATVVIEHKDDLTPAVLIMNGDTVVAEYSIPVGAQVFVNEEDKVEIGGILAKIPRQASKSQDITGGLPRIAELFEARRPKDVAEMAKIEGLVHFDGTVRSKKRLKVVGDDGHSEDHLIPHGKNIIVQAGDRVTKGQLLTDGAPDPHEILEIKGRTELENYIISEIQKVYRRQGVTINDKHIEIIIARMLRKVRISDPGDSDYMWGEQVDRVTIAAVNAEIEAQGGAPATYDPILLGITKASLDTESFISAASFQETTRVLTEASTLARRDKLNGFKENVIMGHLIPAGTGLPAYRRLSISTLGNAVEPEEKKVGKGGKRDKPTRTRSSAPRRARSEENA
jgi:DNA-directed RNA polymerase subunit beta'